jgi:hypothetical protein
MNNVKSKTFKYKYKAYTQQFTRVQLYIKMIIWDMLRLAKEAESSKTDIGSGKS